MRVRKITYLSIVLSLITLMISSSNVFATTSNSSLSLSTNSISQKVNEITQEIASKAASLKSQVTKSIQNKMAVGKISTLNNQQLTIQTDSGTVSVSVNTYTLYQTDPTSGKKTLTLSNFSQGDTVAALGDLDETGVLSAKKIVKLSPQESPIPKYIWGTIQATSEASLTLVGKDHTTSNLQINKNTVFQSDNAKISLSDLKIGFTIIALKPQDSSAAATFVYLSTPLAQVHQ